VAVDGAGEVLPPEDAVVLLREAEEERTAADLLLAEVLRSLGFMDSGRE
jgi:type I restriction enzyme M protein